MHKHLSCSEIGNLSTEDRDLLGQMIRHFFEAERTPQTKTVLSYTCYLAATNVGLPAKKFCTLYGEVFDAIQWFFHKSTIATIEESEKYGDPLPRENFIIDGKSIEGVGEFRADLDEFDPEEVTLSTQSKDSITLDKSTMQEVLDSLKNVHEGDHLAQNPPSRKAEIIRKIESVIHIAHVHSICCPLRK